MLSFKRSLHPLIATAEILLVFPAVLVMSALFVRELQPAQYEPARTAHLLVDWFAARPVLGLDICLISLPFLVLVTGCVVVWRTWRADATLREAAGRTLGAIRAHLPALLTALASLTAGAILAIVALHLITD